MRYLLGRLINILFPEGQCLLIPDNWGELSKCDILLCCHDVDRSLEVEGKAYSPILDSFAQDLQDAGFKVSRLANWGSILAGDKAYGSPKGINRSIFFYKLARKIRSLAPKYLTKVSGAHWPRNPYDSILEKTNCGCIIAIGAHELLIQSARKKGIHVIELLHGIGLIPIPWGWDELEVSSLPTGLLTLDSVSTKTFKKLESKGLQIKQINHPWFRRFNEQSKSKIPDQIEQEIHGKNYTGYILVSLSWSYDGGVPEMSGILPNGVISEELIEAIRDTKDSVFWFLRMHPMQRKNKPKYKQHLRLINTIVEENANAESEVSSICDLHTILSHCTGHVTMCSGISYEAAFMGVPTLLMCPTLGSGGWCEKMFLDLREEGFAELKVRPKSEEIIDWTLNANRPTPKIYGEGAEDLGEVLKWMLDDKIKA